MIARLLRRSCRRDERNLQEPIQGWGDANANRRYFRASSGPSHDRVPATIGLERRQLGQIIGAALDQEDQRRRQMWFAAAGALVGLILFR